MSPILEIQLVAVITAVACALPGVFLVLRRMALMSDAISHAILLGIVLAFFATGSLTSPLLLVAATATGVLTVALIELVHRTRLVKEDAAIGIVFPALFSLAVILINRYAGDVHLDVDVVLLGELAFVPFERLEVLGVDAGPEVLWVMAGILLLNLVVISVFYKELKLTTFDAALAAALGFSPALMHYGFMALVSVTAVGAFNAVGSILVIALMTAPPATAYLLTDRLSRMILWSAAVGASSAVTGYWLSFALDVSIAGSMAAMAGAHFLTAFLLAPDRGVVAVARRRSRQRWELARRTLLIHLFSHENGPAAAEENREAHLREHLRWGAGRATRVVRDAERQGLIRRSTDGTLTLTDHARTLAREAYLHDARLP